MAETTGEKRRKGRVSPKNNVKGKNKKRESKMPSLFYGCG